FEKIEETCPLCNLSHPDFLDWKRQNKSFSDFDVYNRQGTALQTSTGVLPVRTTRVTDGFFRTLGVAPMLGRDFRTGEDLLSAPRTAILTYATWQKSYGGKTDVLGTSVVLGGNAHTIIGVLPREFHFAPAEPTEYWVTMHASSECDLRRSCHGLFGVARLKEGVTFEQALSDVTAIAMRLQQQYPTTNKQQGANLAPLSEVISGSIRPTVLVLLAGAGLLWIIAVTNVSGLMLVRTENRMHELAIRNGLGASGARITSQFVVEGLTLAAIGAALGTASAFWTMRLLSGLISEETLLRMPFLTGLGLNPRVIMFAVVAGLLSAALFAFTPALSLAWSSWSGMRQRLAEGSRRASGNTWRRLGSKLVVVELAMAVVLLAGAGLLARSLQRLLTVKLGIAPDHVAMINVSAPRAYEQDAPAVELERKLIAAVSALPGVQSAGVATKPPVSFSGPTTWFRILGRPWHGEHKEAPFVSVSTGYFQTMGATLLRGRYFTESDDRSKRRVAIVNQAFVREFFPNEDPIGKQLSPPSEKIVPVEIVGVVEDIREGPLDSVTRPTIYDPFAQNKDTDFCLFARTLGDEESSVVSEMSQVVRRIDPEIVTKGGRTMTMQIVSSAYIHRSLALLVGGFAALALLLSVVGLYGVIAYSVGTRTREMGVRMALGASRADVYKLILRDAGGMIAAGIVLGMTGSIGAAYLMRELLFGVELWDVPTLLSVGVTLSLCAIFASLVPARRAAAINPVEALRSE
ncbi:MAG: ABC transporter permease, partial [Acidobacteriaceae bacterium]|nr:ABC transporter permease [Acidobacteriaceae bacterium]